MADLLVLCGVTEEMKDQLAAHFDPAYLREIDDKPAWLRVNGAAIHYVLTDGHLGVAPNILQALPNLRAVSSYGVGYDAIDTDATNARRVPVAHTPDVLNEEVATTALMLFLATWRDLEAQMHNARSGAWAERGSLPLSRSVEGQTVGILGLGRIGKALARKLAPFGVTLLYHGRTAQDVPFAFYPNLAEMARACDTLISIAPGGAATRHLINAQVIEALGPEGCLINVGRGSVVDEAALIAALQDGRLGRAGLDVFEDEPRIPETLRVLPNVVLTPHIGSATIETRRAMGALAVKNLISHQSGQGLLTPVPESAAITSL